MSLAVFGGGGMGNPSHSPRMNVRRHYPRPVADSPLIHDEHANRRDPPPYNHRAQGNTQPNQGALLVPEHEVSLEYVCN